MRWAWILGVLSAATGACVHSRSVVCEDGRLCPEGTVCAELQNPEAKLCVSPDAIRACEGKAALDECTVAGGVPTMRCYDGVCLPAGCGNFRVDPLEACDDGNAVSGDGCSVGCQSDESCGNGHVDPLAVDPDTGLPIANESCDDGNLIGHDGCSSQCQAESVQWSQLGFARPPARSGHAIAYDAARRRFVMFGGGSSLFGDTLESDGNGWVRLPTPVAPSGRTFHAMAYDAERRRVVLFGGLSSSPLRDTWEWDGVSWKLRNTGMSAPEPRSDHAMAYDAARKRVVLFGGLVRDALGVPMLASNKTWEWDGTEWKELGIAGPPGRLRPAMAFDPVRGVIVMGGGQGMAGTALLDTWVYDAAGWREVPNAMTPAHLDFSAVAFDHVTRRVVAFSGKEAGNSVNQMSAWDGQRWIGITPVGSPPPVREGSRMASDPFSGRILLFGGASAGVGELDDTWAWNGATWTQLIPVVPGLITRAAVAHDPLRARLVLFGGLDGQASPAPLGDTWELGATGWTRFPGTPTSPSARFGTALVYDAARQRTVLFGGGIDFSTASMRDDTWTWNGAAWTAHAVGARPSGRHLHAMSYDARERSVLLVGGNRQGPLGDVWKWDGSSWTQSLIDPASLPPRSGHAMIYDPIRESTLLFGGGASPIRDDSRTWDGSAWTLATPFSPPGRDAHKLVWDGNRARVVLFDGFGPTSLLEDLWEWDGVQWQPSFAVAPLAARAGYAMWPAPDGAGLIVFGGDTGRLRPGFPLPRAAFGDTWRLRHDGPGPYEICAGTYDNDGDGLAGCADLDCWATCTPMCPPGTPCDLTYPRCGDAVCNTAVENCRICSTDCSCPAVCGDFFCDDPDENLASCPGDCS